MQILNFFDRTLTEPRHTAHEARATAPAKERGRREVGVEVEVVELTQLTQGEGGRA